MNLIVFPLKHENPFPLKITAGIPVEIDGGALICLTGTGGAGAAVLEKTLLNFPGISTVYEFGSAALVSKGKIGELYECVAFYDFSGAILGETEKATLLPIAAVTGDDLLYTGKKYGWERGVEIPLLYTMETLKFRDVVLNLKRRFVSIRLATDNGSGDIKRQVAEQINLAKKRIKRLLLSLGK